MFFERIKQLDGDTQTVFIPINGRNWGYGKDYMTISSWTIWFLNTVGNFYIGIPEGLVVFIVATVADELIGGTWGNGVSFVHNYQAGFNMYHYFLKNEFDWPIFLAVWAEIAGDLGAVIEELIRNKHIMYSHSAHFQGLIFGVFTAFLIDYITNKLKFKRHRIWWMLPLTIGILFTKELPKLSLFKDVSDQGY